MKRKATEDQKQVLRKHNIKFRDDISNKEASVLITKIVRAKARKPYELGFGHFYKDRFDFFDTKVKWKVK